MSAPTSRARRVVHGLLRAPLFTSVAIVTLAVGIGANTAIFSVLYAVLLKPLPLDHPERLVGVWHTAPGLNIPVLSQGPATYLTYREENRVFEQIGLWDGASVAVTGRGEPEKVEALLVSDSTLPALQVKPLLGRRFTAEDDSPKAPERAMLTYGYWQKKFGGSRDVVGQTLIVEGTPNEIIGVLP